MINKIANFIKERLAFLLPNISIENFQTDRSFSNVPLLFSNIFDRYFSNIF